MSHKFAKVNICPKCGERLDIEETENGAGDDVVRLAHTSGDCTWADDWMLPEQVTRERPTPPRSRS